MRLPRPSFSISRLAIGLAVAALPFISSSHAPAQVAQQLAVPDTAAGALGRRMDAHVAAQAALGFSGQVLVARGGDLILHRGYGFADRAARRPLTTATRVGIASASKQLTAAAVLRLVQDGRLSLADSLGALLPGVPADKRGITLEMLLTHTSGIRGGFTEDFDVATLDESVTRLLAQPLGFAPGARWRYSSDAYGLLAAVVQRVSGMPFEAYLRSALFAPAGMRSTGFWWEARGDTTVARAYAGWRDRGSPAEWPRNWRVFGSGDVLTTAADLYRWHRALAAGRVLDAATRATYFTPRAEMPGGARYGYGLMFDASELGGEMIEHGGDTEAGFNAAFFRYPASDAVIIVVSNARDARGLSARQLVQANLEALLFGADSAVHTPPVSPLPAAGLARLAGAYDVPGGGTLHLLSDGAHLWAAAEGQAAVALLRPADPRDAADRAGARTRRLLDGLLARDTAAFDTALTDSGRVHREGYVAEWREMLARRGPLHGYTLLGTVRQGRAAVTWARLRFLHGDATMTFTWPNDATGRLAGTDPLAAPFPAAFPVAAEGGALAVRDPLRGLLLVRVRPQPDGALLLEPEGAPPVRTAAVRRDGWTPR